MKGRKPKPTALKVLEGTRKDRINKHEPRFEKHRPPCPRTLSKAAKKEWRRLTPLLDAAGLLTRADKGILAAYCSAYAEWVAAERLVDETGLVVTAPSGYQMPAPALSIARKARTDMVKFGDALGLNPLARTRIKVNPKKTAQGLFSVPVGKDLLS